MVPRSGPKGCCVWRSGKSARDGHEKRGPGAGDRGAREGIDQKRRRDAVENMKAHWTMHGIRPDPEDEGQEVVVKRPPHAVSDQVRVLEPEHAVPRSRRRPSSRKVERQLGRQRGTELEGVPESLHGMSLCLSIGHLDILT